MTPMETKEEQELRRATEALEEQRYEQRKAALAAVRAEYQAQWDDEDALASAEDRVKLLAAALEWDEQRRASQKSRSKGIGLDNPATGDDREAPWAHTDHHEEGGLEDHDGDLSDYL